MLPTLMMWPYFVAGGSTELAENDDYVVRWACSEVEECERTEGHRHNGWSDHLQGRVRLQAQWGWAQRGLPPHPGGRHHRGHHVAPVPTGGHGREPPGVAWGVQPADGEDGILPGPVCRVHREGAGRHRAAGTGQAGTEAKDIVEGKLPVGKATDGARRLRLRLPHGWVGLILMLWSPMLWSPL